MPILRALALIISVSLCLVAVVYAQDTKAPEGAEQWSAYGTYVDGAGNISLPENFVETWVHLGTVAIHEEESVVDLHSTYAPRWAVDHFQANKEFPDGAMLVKEVRHARGSTLTTGNAYWADDVVVWFVMVKDRKNRFPDNLLWGKGWGWALFNGDDRKTQVATNYADDCLSCHVPVKDHDWNYVYTYPVFGEYAKQLAPSAEGPTVAGVAGGEEDIVSEEVLKKGSKIFNRCKACHSLEPGKHKSGPSLAGVFGRKAGTAEGYDGSAAMRNSGITWGTDTLDRHLADVVNFIPGNKMAKLFPSGVKKPEDREALIHFLRQAE